MPLKLAAGSYLRVPSAFCVTLPLVGWVKLETLSLSPSGSESLASTSMFLAVSSSVVSESLTALGARLKLTVVLSDEVLSARFASFSALSIRALFTYSVPKAAFAGIFAWSVWDTLAPLASDPTFHVTSLPATVQVPEQLPAT